MPSEPLSQASTAVVTPENGQIGQNIAAVHEFYTREEQKRSASQRNAESIGGFVGRPAFLIVILLLVSVWMGVNLALPAWGLAPLDAPPFFWLQGVVGLAGRRDGAGTRHPAVPRPVQGGENQAAGAADQSLPPGAG